MLAHEQYWRQIDCALHEYFYQPNVDGTLKKLGYKKDEINNLKEKIYTGNIDDNILLEIIEKGRKNNLSDNEVFSILL